MQTRTRRHGGNELRCAWLHCLTFNESFSTSNNLATPTATCLASSTPPLAAMSSPPQQQLAELQAMGFHPSACHHALQLTNHSLHRAIDWLLSNPDEAAAAASGAPAQPGIFSMGFDEAVARRAMAQAGGDEARAVAMILNGEVAGECVCGWVHVCVRLRVRVCSSHTRHRNRRVAITRALPPSPPPPIHPCPNSKGTRGRIPTRDCSTTRQSCS